MPEEPVEEQIVGVRFDIQRCDYGIERRGLLLIADPQLAPGWYVRARSRLREENGER